MPINHSFTNPKSDGADATIQRPSDWNAAHTITGLGLTTIAPTSDTSVNSESPTGNGDTSTELILRNTWGTSSFTRFVLHTWDISSLAGLVVAKADIVLVVAGSDGSQTDGRTLAVREILRSYVTGEVTWNQYSSGNNWATAGGQGSGDIGARKYGNAVIQQRGTSGLTIGAEYTFDITTLVQAYVDATTYTLRTSTGSTSASPWGSGEGNISFASLEHATSAYRPFMRVLALPALV